MKDFKSLKDDIFDEIRDAAAKKNSGEMISRRGFDHLLWYYHKGQ